MNSSLVKLFFSLLLLTGLIEGARNQKISTESDLLKRILENYDKNVRPPTGNVTIVKVNLFVRRISEICPKSMEYTLQLNFRQKWTDQRLNFVQESALTYLSLSSDDSLRSSFSIWTPDLFFSNEVGSKSHYLMRPNVLIRIYNNGEVLMSARITVTLSCPMNLRIFPFDTQSCPLTIGSYGYKNDEIRLEWEENRPIQLTNNLLVKEYELKKYFYRDGMSKTVTGSYSYIESIMVFRRLPNYYFITIYIPSLMLVIISWLSFWINVKDVALKTGICLSSLITLSLAITFLNQISLPRTDYTKAIDLWTGFCLTFIFAALIESISVYYKQIRCSKLNSAEENQSDKNVSNKNVLTNNELVKKYLNFIIDSKSDPIDCISRCAFPILFLLFIFIYFIVYC